VGHSPATTMDAASDTRHYGVCDVRNIALCRNDLSIAAYSPRNGSFCHRKPHHSQIHRGNCQDSTAAVEPAAVEPAAVEPAVVELAVAELAVAELAVAELAVAEPAVAEPAVVELVPQ